MNIEPIHELEADELQYALDNARDHIKRELKSPPDSVLNTLADSIKKSLVFLFPKFDKLIQEINPANKASYAMSWARGHYPLREGVEALQKIYDLLHRYRKPNDFKEMEQAIKEYSRIAEQYFHKDKIKEINQNIDQVAKEIAPVIKFGKQKIVQVHAHRQKKNKALRKYCSELMLKKPSPSAAHLRGRFPEKGKAITIDGTKIFREETDDGEEKIFCIAPTGKQITVAERAFSNYFKDIKKV